MQQAFSQHASDVKRGQPDDNEAEPDVKIADEFCLSRGEEGAEGAGAAGFSFGEQASKDDNGEGDQHEHDHPAAQGVMPGRPWWIEA